MAISATLDPLVVCSCFFSRYDPEGMAHCANNFYSPQNLLKREALRFEPQIQFLLRTIWRATDADDSGAIDKIEYIELHSCMTCSLIGRAAGDSMMRMFLCKEDWDADRKGFKTLNRRRLEDCFFTLADRWTSLSQHPPYWMQCMPFYYCRVSK